MKRFAALTLAVLMLLTVFASAASAVPAANDSVEIRGPVYNGSSINDIISTQGDAGAITMDASKFAAFYYDLTNNVTTESLSIKNVAGNSGNVIGEHGLVYQTTIQPVAFKYAAWGNYSVLGLFEDQFVPLKSSDASKLTKLVVDSKDKFTIKVGESKDLGLNYSLQAKQVNIDGKKVWLELDKDGQHVADQIITLDGVDQTWTCKLPVLGLDDVPVLKVHINQVFQGTADTIVQMDGLWLIDYANAMKINSDEFGKLNDVSVNGPTLLFSNKDAFVMPRDSKQSIGHGLSFRIADTPSNMIRFYAFKQVTDPGTYKIRGQVVSGPQDFTWDASNFAGFFYYDLNEDIATESLSVSGISGRVIPEKGLKYSTTIKNVPYKNTNWGTYPVVGLFGEKYVALSPNDASKLAKLVVDSKDKFTVKIGENKDLGQNYSLQAKQVDVDGKKVWLELDKDGQHVADQIVQLTGDGTWTLKLPVLGLDDVPVLKVHINQVFQGTADTIVQMDSLWFIDYANAMKISTNDEFGKLNAVSINGPTLNIQNKDIFTLAKDSTKEIGQGMSFQVADSDVLRYYPFVEQTLGNIGNKTTVTTTTTNVTVPGVNASVNQTNVTTVPAENVPVANETTAANATKEEKKTPGFGVVLGITGLLAVVYFVRRNR
jgi:S-layer protein (TIGR01567 family)